MSRFFRKKKILKLGVDVADLTKARIAFFFFNLYWETSYIYCYFSSLEPERIGTILLLLNSCSQMHCLPVVGQRCHLRSWPLPYRYSTGIQDFWLQSFNDHMLPSPPVGNIIWSPIFLLLSFSSFCSSSIFSALFSTILHRFHLIISLFCIFPLSFLLIHISLPPSHQLTFPPSGFQNIILK